MWPVELHVVDLEGYTVVAESSEEFFGCETLSKSSCRHLNVENPALLARAVVAM